MQSSIDENLSEIVRDYRLETRYEVNFTVHLYNDPDTPPSAPQRRERWEKVRTIGQGGQSEVVLETCVDGGRHFTERAVKKIRLQTDSKRRYESELGAIVKFSHDKYSKYFVKSLGWFATSRKLYMAMEYFPAGDLYSYVRKHQGLPEEDCRQITCQLLSAIAIMHTEGFAHRDIKPQNILIHSHPNADGQGSWWVKLGDFGISKKIGAGPNITTSSVGTMLYMAPELFDESYSETRTVNHQEADLWSLGITVFFILTNAVPFQTPASTMKFAQNSGEPFPSAFLDHYGVTGEGQAFIRETLRPEPGTRLNFAMAMDHAWIQGLFPSVVVSGTHSRPSTISSRRSSVEDDSVVQDLTTEVSTLSSQPVSLGQNHGGPILFDPDPRRVDCPLIGEFETTPVNEATADVCSGTHNRWFAKSKSERVSDIKRLHRAAMFGQVKNVEMLLDQGVSPTAFHDGESPLHASAKSINVEVTRLLCDRNIDIEAKDENGWTALITAVHWAKSHAVEVLLEKGADIEAKDESGWTALIHAAREGHYTVIELLLEKGADIEAEDKEGWTALIHAAREGHYTVIELLLEKGADIEAKDKDGRTALLFAVSEGNRNAIELLLEKGADIEAKDKEGWTALTLATFWKRCTIIELLLEKGADIEAEDKDGQTALIVAVRNGNRNVTELLLKKGANANVRAEYGITPLWYAQKEEGKHLVDVLLQHGATN